MNQPASASARALMVFAHADDETLLAGALISKLATDGYLVKVLCLAPGSDERTKRLRKACEILGVFERFTGNAYEMRNCSLFQVVRISAILPGLLRSVETNSNQKYIRGG